MRLLGVATTAAALLLTTPSIAQEANASASAVKPLMEEQALTLLRRGSERVGALKSFRFEVQDTREVPSSQGQLITFVTDSVVTVQRPDMLRVEAWNGAKQTDYFYDGKAFTILDRTNNFFVTEDAPGGIETMLAQSGKKHGVQFAIADFLSPEPYEILSNGLTHAYMVGETVIDGMRTRQAAFAAPGIEFQLWVDSLDYPKMMTVTYLDSDRPVHFQIRFQKWTALEPLPSSQFTFHVPAGAQRIEFLEVDKP